MDARRHELLDHLERYYRGCGWKVERPDDGTVRALGTGGVTWIGMAIVPEDLDAPDFRDRLLELSDQRMSASGERCPFELLPAAECAEAVRRVLESLSLSERVPVYGFAA